MGHEIEFDIVIRDAISAGDFLLHVRSTSENEFVQLPGRSDDVASPVVVELKAGKMFLPVVDPAFHCQLPVAIAAGPQGIEYLEVCVEFQRQSEDVDGHLIQRPVGDHVVCKLTEAFAWLHGKRDRSRPFGVVRAHGATRESAPHELTGLRIVELRAQDPRDHDDGIALRAIELRRSVIEPTQVRRRVGSRTAPQKKAKPATQKEPNPAHEHFSPNPHRTSMASSVMSSWRRSPPA